MIIFLYSIMCFIFGTTFLAIKIGVDAGLPPFFSAGIRFLLAGAIIFLFFFCRDRSIRGLLLRKELIFTGFSLTFITFSCLYWAEQYVTSGIAAVLSATGPILIIMLQRIMFKTRIAMISMIGVVIGFIGVLFLFLPGLTIEFNTKWLIGCSVILLGEIGYAWGTIYSSKVIAALKSDSPIVLNAVQMIYGGLFLIMISVISKESIPSFSIEGISSIAYLIIAGSMLGHTIYYYLVAKTNSFFPSTWLYVSPLIALAIGSLFYKEYFHPIMFVGILFILTSLLLINYHKIQNHAKSKKITAAKSINIS
ncbi:DMT family transporter [Niallia nealsonii]|uniref:EamA family transporter n=1 Tax=Niallia nealsonii TaxID=115979 RepID=A0A2N0Z0H5_9BACI|nr:EamA family transporter [Niallia nealsonii]PKG23016.1 EamA family transporter [Niallia nealsonii]